MAGIRMWLKGLMLGAAIGCISAAFALSPAGIALEESLGLPLLFAIRGRIPPPPEVAVVAINQRAAEALELPPHPRNWPRSVHGELVDTLVAHGASAIVFDLRFEKRPDESGESGETDRSDESENEAFAAAVERANRVVLLEHMDKRLESFAIDKGGTGATAETDHATGPVEPLARAATVVAPFLLPKTAGNVNQFWAFWPGDGPVATIPTAALWLHALRTDRGALPPIQALVAGEQRRLAAAAGGDGALSVREMLVRAREGLAGRSDIVAALGAGGDPAMRPSASILTRRLAALFAGSDIRYLNFYGPPGTIPVIGYDVLIAAARAGMPAAIRLDDRCVFVGVADYSTPTQDDGFATVFTGADGIDLSGVEIAATAFANLLTDTSLRPPAPLTSAAMLFVLCSVIGFYVLAVPARLAVPAALALAAAYVAVAQILFNRAALWLPLVTPAFAIALLVVSALYCHYVVARRQREKMQQAISYYIPERVVQGFADSGGDMSAANEVVYATCLAADMEDFTPLAEGMRPGEVASLLNSYFDAIAKPINDRKADVVEFRADGMMCAWTAPQPQAEVRARACAAAIGARDAAAAFAAKVAPRPLGVRLGLHDGEVFVGHSGGGGRFVYGIVGDIANTAARIEGLNRYLGTRLLASAGVVRALDHLRVRPVGQFILKGKNEPLSIVEIVGRRDTVSVQTETLCRRFAVALQAFSAGNAEAAQVLFAALLRDYPADGPSRFYLNRLLGEEGGQAGQEAPMIIRMGTK
ncbi:MAG: adenylate/guanylate cyclase domain-containing protein [Defluviicoccus sp.]|uniref:CHASE2 domain-containing protein n=1 Tax=Accumulibacter sp. TaxID=2053492 RepID=UPI00287848B8|nr:adenylate/guanylate cyclase domain-containing protein [Accumulibacter sp.]MDG4576639.1 adenylate/guanylate cyclase domain-containing protein [Defluviicoccus sp.]MDG4593424.1 adenylate/guanylate cyclase domain-containing protein [Defluviicoccus sp.]MDS4015262.1 adenylate/guanylate cyclase domain-containing protein [Accumulibacter sp.]